MEPGRCAGRTAPPGDIPMNTLGDVMQTTGKIIDAIRIGGRWVGEGHPCYIVAEIGINHNGDIDLARRLISVAVAAGCDAVKFQKRTVDVVYSAEELAKPRENPFGTTNGDLKRGLEFGYEEYRLIDALLPRSENALVRLLLGRSLGRFHRPVRLRPATRSLPRRSPTTHCFATRARRASRSSSPPA